ncbi:uncharacterized protein LOC143514726 isoform X2 [Brachyhypopomus gauderio]|uniref:uncharacterized protein LOC143514726 isoform X2 n=1 Tax=Brachyhypopomus gauderio TaxID=698409 RepID=UPI004042113B
MSFLFQLILVLLPSPTLLLPQNAALQHVSRDTKPQPIKVVISEPCVLGESSDAGGGREAELDGDSTVVLTHRIRLVPAAATATAGCGGCEVEMAVIRERIERLEKEVSELRGRCGGADGSCCTPQQSKGGGCTTVGPPTGACPDDCNDQGVCVEGRCDCFPGFSGPDCRTSNCPGNCHDNGKCVSGQCVCDPGFIGPDCSEAACPRNCSLHGRCMGGVCVCEPGLSGPDCSIKACPKSCSNRGRCVSGRCVCDPGFIGPACTARTCPGNCNRKGRCVNGKCVCETGVTGPDCSERSCPGNCKNRGQCVNGKCVCETGFTGPDCSERSCPGNCNDKGQCVNGQCVCDTGFTGPDCFTKTCPSNCNSNGKCVNGKCVCAASFTGVDCSSKSCPANCHDRGQCVDGHCVCDVDFTGPDCSTKSCPKNCSGRGFCVKGRCVCGRGSTGPDCGQCDYGFTGHDCRTVLSGVANLSTRDVTESSVTLFWTPPDVQYDTYHITFTSEESDQKVVSSVSGRLTSYMQVGLAAGQQYTVTMIGEKEGKEGAVSRTEFQTLISGPKNLQVVKMSTTSIIVQWEQAQGDIDRYLLNVSPNQTDGSGPQETRLPPERDSAEIDSLEPGRLYDITLVAERDDTRSLPVTVQATPGISTKMNPRVTEKTVTTQVALGTDHSDGNVHETKPNRTILLLKNHGEEEIGQRKSFKVLETSEGFRKPRIDMPRQGKLTNDGKDKVFFRPGTRPDTIRRPNITLRFNGRRPGSGGAKPGHVPAKTLTGRFSAEWPRTKTPSVHTGLQHPTTRDKVAALTLKEIGQRSASEETTEGSRRRIQPHHSKMEPEGQEVTNNTQGSRSISISEERTNSAGHPEPYINVSELTEETLAPTITTEKNITAYINGTKCVRKVLVGHKKIILNETVNGKPLTKNVTVIVSHINGNEILEKILTGRPEGVNDVTPLNEEGAQLHSDKSKQKPSVDQMLEKQEEAIHEGNEESGKMGIAILPTSLSTQTFSQQPVKVTIQEEESWTRLPRQPTYLMTSPSPPLPTHHSKPSLVLSTHNQHSNNDQVLKDRHPTRISFQSPPSFRQRFPARSKSPGSSAPMIKGRHPSRHIPSVMSQIPTDIHPNENIPFVALPSLFVVEKETLGRETVISGESEPDDQSSLTTSDQNFSTPPPSTNLLVTVSSTYSEKMKKGNEKEMLETEQTETKEMKVPLFRRMPFKGTLPHHPKTRLFQNQTQPFQKVPRQPHRSWLLRLAPPTTSITHNITVGKIILQHQEEPENNSAGPSGSGPTITKRKRNDTVNRFPPRSHTQIQRNASTVHRGPKESRYDTNGSDSLTGLTSEKDASEVSTVGSSSDKVKEPKVVLLSEKTNTNGTFQTVGGGPKADTGRILPRITHSSSATITHPQGKPGSISGRQNDPSGTIIRTPPKLHTPNVTIIHKRPKESEDGPGGTSDSQTGLAAQQDTQKKSKIDLPAAKVEDSEDIISAERTNTNSAAGGLNIKGILPRTTNRLSSSDVITHHHAEPKNITRKNSTNIRLPSRLWTRINPNRSTIYTEPKGRKDSKAEKDSTADPSKDTIIESKPGLSIDKDTSKDPNMPLLTEKVTSKVSKVAPSTDKAGGKKNQEESVFSGGSENGIDHIAVQNVTSQGFTVIWGAPIGMFKNFIITITEGGGQRAELRNKKVDGITQDGNINVGDEQDQGGLVQEAKVPLDKEPADLLRIPPGSHITRKDSSDGGVTKNVTKVLPGSARSFPVTGLSPQTAYSMSLYGQGSGLHSSVHHFTISTGPEPPSHLAFSEVSESSLMVSWTRPKSPVSGFKVTYMHTKDGEPVSMAVGSADSSLVLSQLSPGSSYEVSVLSLRGLDESEPIRDTVITLPDPPSDLDVINVTNTKALLLWRPALATVDQYVIVYSSEEAPGSELTIRVSGNTVEQALQALTSSTRYTVSISSQLGDIRSAGSATASFTTSGPVGRGEGPQDLKASQVTPRTALLSWKPPASAVTGYKLTYVTEGQEIKEVSLAPGVTEHKLRRLRPGSVYTANLQGERDGLYTATISTEFTTGSLRFPFPTDCSQELLNGLRESDVVEIFPGGRQTKPVMVYCDMDTDGGGWTVFQRRKDGKINFFRAWKEYRTGFGELDGEFWLGNDLLHNLTSMTPMTLRVDLRAGAEAVYAQYSTFSVGTAKKHFMLQVMGYSGTAGDSMKYHDKRPFSTWDRDPQPFITRCAMSYRGGWWYRNCHEANLNGLYGTHTNHQGLIWTAWKGTRFSIPFTEMKLRPTSFDPFSQT